MEQEKGQSGNRQIRQLIIASRIPHLPVDDYRIIIRPRGGLNVTEHGTDRIYHSVRRAANVERTADEEDNLCLNQKQNIIVLSTPSKERAKKYVAITSLSIGSKEYEARAYRAAPENTSKGVMRGISADESPEDIVRKLVNPRNPSVLYAKRMGNTNNVIVIFDGYYVPSYVNYGAALVRCALYKKQFDICYECGRLGHRADVCPNPTDKICRSCGTKNPKQDHECKAECQLCGNDHPTADKRCQERYRIPYLVKRRRWERARREEQVEYENYVDNQRSPSTASRNRSVSLPRTTSRSHSGNRSRSRSRPRSGNPTKSPLAIGNSKGTIGNHTTGPPSQCRGLPSPQVHQECERGISPVPGVDQYCARDACYTVWDVPEASLYSWPIRMSLAYLGMRGEWVAEVGEKLSTRWIEEKALVLAGQMGLEQFIEGIVYPERQMTLIGAIVWNPECDYGGFADKRTHAVTLCPR
ncbi:hypothetical protein HPB49_023145 [Dermacentor silvarum]|uniref:Uncharacterized protein n=1 Tax=Dermacentor silvarum TaxID=543639 RepID=A0ACB8CTG9_DERSI|nr:hypothetical protein HPB49_023145 [Dermacentor silvarum]